MIAVEMEISHYSLNVLHSFGTDMDFTNEFVDAVFLLRKRDFYTL